MRNLLHAVFFRWKKSKCLWIGAAVMAASSALSCISIYRIGAKYEMQMPWDGQLFGGVWLVGIMIAVFCSMFVGTEYSDGTIRNKIIAGHARGTIYLMNFLFCAAAGVLFFAVAVFAAFITGVLLMDQAAFAAKDLCLFAADGVLMCVATAAVGTLICMLIPNKAYAAVTGILLMLIFLFAGSYLVSRLGEPEMYETYEFVADGEPLESQVAPNPLYLSGTQRSVCEFMVDAIPGGQAYQLANQAVARPYRILWCAAVETIVMNAAGICFFRRKDLN